ncbi:hypothetical protein AMJ85_03190 [candidate division BRC1 bacterium SM23_51]|nr:MAG: hypothetical protein AMJ85_03190 [candidate division BRC1 bacterium SM23_51]
MSRGRHNASWRRWLAVARWRNPPYGGDRELLQRQIAATDREIDRLVYDLYDLTEDEIRIVEEG